jgi:transcriptional regulator with XRE-family HTH domain
MNGIDRVVADRLRALRQSRHLSLEQMAERMGIAVTTLVSYEAGEARIAAACLVEIARRFEVPVSSFFQGLERTGSTDSPEAVSTSNRDAIISYLFGDRSEPQKRALLSLVKVLTDEPETRDRPHGT